MRRCLASWIIILLAFRVSAQPMGHEAAACVPGARSPMTEEYEQTSRTEEWPQEARQLKADVPNVSRHGDRLRLAVDGGRAVDCKIVPTAMPATGIFMNALMIPGAYTSCARRVSTISPTPL